MDMIVLNNSHLNNDTIQVLNKLIEELIDIEIDAQISYRLVKIIKKLSQLKEEKNRMEEMLISKYADKDELGQIIQAKDINGDLIPNGVTITDMDAFSMEMSNLMNASIQIPYEKINFSDLGIKTITIREMMLLEFLFN